MGDNTKTNSNSPINIICSNLGIEELDNSRITFSIYPNPTKDAIYFQNSAHKSIEKVTITDLNGKIVFKQSNNPVEINVQRLKQGIYIIQILSEGEVFKSKFIKE
ncbi:hypothetical protein D3C86_1536720 [compost metagenome]